jgi:magnesium transporter
MIRTFCFVPGEDLHTDIPVKEYSSYLNNPNGLFWVDFLNEPNPSAEAILTGIFRFHPLAVDDALQETHTPKVDDWGDYLYIVFNALAINREDGLDVNINELDVFLGHNFVVTHHDTPIPAIEKAWSSINTDKRYINHGPDHLLYKIIDDLVADYWPLIETLDGEIDWVEDQVFTNAKPEMLERMFALKRALVAIRRIITPQREVLNRLARDDFDVVDSKDRIFFRDIYDHLVRLHDLTESMRDLLSGTMDAYLSVINNRMNEVMKILTIITTLFMPITFITGFFGMNFFSPVAEGLGKWTGYAAFIAMLLVIAGTPAVMFTWMRRRTWV